MSTTRTLLLAGNWKMNLDHLQAISTVQKLAWSLKDHRVDIEKAEVAVLPPFTDIRSVQTLIQGDKLPIAYGGQDLSAHDEGAYTGEVSGAFLNRLRCTYVIVGHSERRAYHSETDEVVASKLRAALRHELTPILCVGESLETRQAGEHVEFTLGQVERALDGLSADELSGLVIAYEPVWAIGTGETATAGDAAEMCSAIRNRLEELYDAGFAGTVRLLYGGSVKTENVAEIVAHDDVDGALVGGASLDPESFASLCHAASSQ